MKFDKAYPAAEIASWVGGVTKGASELFIDGLNEIHVIQSGELVFVDHPKYYEKALNSAASCILINHDVDVPAGKVLIIVSDPFSAFNAISGRFRPFVPSSATISPNTIIGEGTILQPGVFIGDDVTIGSNCIIQPNVVIMPHTKIGNNVIIQSGTVIGSDAFYYKKRLTGFDRLKSCGGVLIEDNVEIGANCTIDRGVTAETTIGKGSILDNLIQIGHDTKIGARCLIAAQVGIAGCVVIEDEVTFWGQVGVASGVTIGAKAVLLAQSGVSKSLEGNTVYFGSPADDAKIKMKELAALRKLPSKISVL